MVILGKNINRMPFSSPFQPANNRFQDYLFSLLLITGAYVLGNLPALFIYTALDSGSGDLFEVLQAGVGKTMTFALLLAPWVFVFFGVLLATKYILKWPVTFVFTNRERLDFKRISVGFFLWLIISLVTFFFTFNEQVILNFDAGKFIPLLAVSVVVLLLQCAAEELVFRSFLLKWLGRRTSNVVIPVLVTGTIFGLLHGSNPEVEALGNIALVFYIGTGIFLGLIAILDDGLELTIGFHFANNLFAALIVTSNWQVFQTDAVFIDYNPPSFDLIDFLTVFGGQLVFFLVCWKVYRWNLRKGKLV
jgi:membrane protease YdiL (CAAX protease family)